MSDRDPAVWRTAGLIALLAVVWSYSPAAGAADAGAAGSAGGGAVVQSTAATLAVAPHDATVPDVVPIAVASSAAVVIVDPGREPAPVFVGVNHLGIGYQLLAGYHRFSGWHWRNRDPASYDGPQYEVAAFARIRELNVVRLDGAVSAGLAQGSACAPDSPSSCIRNHFTTLILDLGPRATFRTRKGGFLFAGAGVGVMYATYSYRVSANDPAFGVAGGGSTSAFAPSVHVLVGGGFTRGPFAFVAELKQLQADVRFPAHRSGGFYNDAFPLSMGGSTVLVGVQYRR